jgi:hypothetical protein
LTISSGIEVPKDTIVNPIIKSEILNRFAREEAPSTSKSAPLISAGKPSTKSKYVNISNPVDGSPAAYSPQKNN